MASAALLAVVALLIGSIGDRALTSSSSAEALLDRRVGPPVEARPGDPGPPVGTGDGAIPDGLVVTVFDVEVPAVGNLDAELRAALQRATDDAAGDDVVLRVNSGWRSPALQNQLLQDAIVEYGSPEEAARWVATPETSAHVSGEAVDLGPPDAAAWLSRHGAEHGLCPIYANEPWHFELRPDAVTEGCPRMYADPTDDPRLQS